MKLPLRCAGLVLALKLSAADPVALDWLGGTPPATGANVTWGVPWPKGAVPAGTAMRLKSKTR